MGGNGRGMVPWQVLHGEDEQRGDVQPIGVLRKIDLLEEPECAPDARARACLHMRANLANRGLQLRADSSAAIMFV
jgi:hypothetical protein